MKIGIVYSEGDFSEAFPHDYKGRTSFFEDVNEALRNLKLETVLIPANKDMFETLIKGKFNAVFNAADEGYNMNTQLEPQIPAILDIIGVPYTGSNYLTLGLCLDKVKTKQLLIANGLPTADFIVIEEKIDENIDLKKLKFPMIVKPSREDGSIGIKADSVVDNKKELINKVNEVLKIYKQPILVEEFIQGREIYVGILGRDDLNVLPLSEIQFTLPEGKKHFLPYEAKWEEDSVYYTGTTPACPAKIDKELEEKLRSLAKKAYKLFNLRDYGRVDFRIDKEGRPFILEVNPNPDISRNAGLANMAKANNISYEDLIFSIIKNSKR